MKTLFSGYNTSDRVMHEVEIALDLYGTLTRQKYESMALHQMAAVALYGLRESLPLRAVRFRAIEALHTGNWDGFVPYNVYDNIGIMRSRDVLDRWRAAEIGSDINAVSSECLVVRNAFSSAGTSNLFETRMVFLAYMKILESIQQECRQTAEASLFVAFESVAKACAGTKYYKSMVDSFVTAFPHSLISHDGGVDEIYKSVPYRG